MTTFYKSLYRGWVEVTEQQRKNLIKHMENGITALSDAEKQNYIKGKFKVVEGLTMKCTTIPDEYTPEEIEETLEGALADSVLYWHNGEYVAFMVAPATTWTSCYTMYTGDEAERVFWNRAKVNYKVGSYEFTVDYTLDSYEAEQETASIIDGLMRYMNTDDIEQAEFNADHVDFSNASGEVVAIARRV